MANEANMYYRFTSDDEPSEYQLTLLMQRVEEEVRERKSKIQSIISENILRECQNAKQMFPNL